LIIINIRSDEKMNDLIEKKDDDNDMKELKKVLSTVSTEVPALIKNIFASLYSADTAAEFGKAIGQLYKEMKDQGLPEDMIREIVMKYADSINLVGNALKSESNQKKYEFNISGDDIKGKNNH
jgi:hypothetical protein